MTLVLWSEVKMYMDLGRSQWTIAHKNGQRKVQRKRYVFHENDSRFYSQVILKIVFNKTSTNYKNMGWKLCFCYLTSFIGVPPPLTKLILLHTFVVLRSTHHIKMAWLVTGWGGEDVKMLKTKYHKNLLGTNFAQTCRGKYQFTMACIRAFVMIMCQVINCLISQPKTYVVGNKKNCRNETVLLSTK